MVRFFYVKYTEMLSFFPVTRGPDGPDLPSLSGQKFQFSVQFSSARDTNNNTVILLNLLGYCLTRGPMGHILDTGIMCSRAIRV